MGVVNTLLSMYSAGGNLPMIDCYVKMEKIKYGPIAPDCWCTYQLVRTAVYCYCLAVLL